jgi:4-amino-4-deoxy-L-arabinose transferase-like glycosyltransferase
VTDRRAYALGWSPTRGLLDWMSQRDLLRPAVELAGMAILLTVAGFIFVAPLHSATNYDEGNYLAALTDLQHGFTLGKDVYADQPPGWYTLLRILSWLFGNSVTGIRTGLIVISLLGVVAAWLCARPWGPLPAFGAAAVLVVAPPYPSQAFQVEADSAAAVVALAALALGVWGYRRRSRGLAVAAGAVLACAVSVKLSAATVVLPFAAVALWSRRLSVWSVLGAAAVIGIEAFAFRHELSQIASGAVGQHTSALGSPHWSRSTNVHRLLHFLDWHTPFAWLVLAAVVAAVALGRGKGRVVIRLGALWLFVPAAAAFILAMKPLLGHHLVILAVSIAVPAGATLGLAASRLRLAGTAALVGVALLFLAAGAVQQRRQLARGSVPEPQWIHRAADWLRAETKPNAVVATDIPIVAYYAHRRLIPDFVDTSFTRLGVGELTPATVFAQLDRYDVRVAAIGRTFWADPAIRKEFDRRFRERRLGTNIVYYVGRRAP